MEISELFEIMDVIVKNLKECELSKEYSDIASYLPHIRKINSLDNPHF